MEEEDNDFEGLIDKLEAEDLRQVDRAMNNLIDPLSRFKSASSITELEPQEFAELLFALEHAHFVIAGLMYSSGWNPYDECNHDHDEEEDEE